MCLAAEGWGITPLHIEEVHSSFFDDPHRFVAHGQPAVLLVVGEDDDVDGFRKPAEELHRRLEATYADPTRVELMIVPNMAHALAAEPGIERAPQTWQARTVDRRSVRWLEDHFMGARAHLSPLTDLD